MQDSFYNTLFNFGVIPQNPVFNNDFSFPNIN